MNEKKDMKHEKRETVKAERWKMFFLCAMKKKFGQNKSDLMLTERDFQRRDLH